MCWDSEARFQTCDYWVFDQVASRTWKGGERVKRNQWLVFNYNMLKISKKHVLCENSKDYFGRYHSCTAFHMWKNCLMSAKEVIIKWGWKRHSYSLRLKFKKSVWKHFKCKTFLPPNSRWLSFSSRRQRRGNFYILWLLGWLVLLLLRYMQAKPLSDRLEAPISLL